MLPTVVTIVPCEKSKGSILVNLQILIVLYMVFLKEILFIENQVFGFCLHCCQVHIEQRLDVGLPVMANHSITNQSVLPPGQQQTTLLPPAEEFVADEFGRVNNFATV